MYVHVYAHRFTITWNVIARGVKGLSCGDPALFNLPRGGRKWRFCLVGVVGAVISNPSDFEGEIERMEIDITAKI